MSAALRPPGPFVAVLGIAQDGGIPHAGCRAACCAAAWSDRSRRHLVSCIAVVDPRRGAFWLIDATPDLREQLQAVPPHLALAGVFLTHAHIGHYLGLAFFGREAIGARGLPVYTMPRMHAFLRSSGPWEQLVRLEQIALRPLRDGASVDLATEVEPPPEAEPSPEAQLPPEPRPRAEDVLTVTPFRVPHRGEYTETVGYRVQGPRRVVAYIPDIDGWAATHRDAILAQRDPRSRTAGVVLEDLIRSVDAVWIDGTFYDDAELPHRDPREIPHPRIADSLRRLAALTSAERAKVRFIHLNHTNPALDPRSAARGAVEASGCRLAAEGERFEL